MVASERLRRLLDLQNRFQAELNATLVGRELEVLVTGWGREEGTLTGRTSCHRIVHFKTSGPMPALGTFVPLRIVRPLGHSLVGEPLATLATPDRAEPRLTPTAAVGVAAAVSAAAAGAAGRPAARLRVLPQAS